MDATCLYYYVFAFVFVFKVEFYNRSNLAIVWSNRKTTTVFCHEDGNMLVLVSEKECTAGVPSVIFICRKEFEFPEDRTA
jgi:hypothetical protein